jgi:uncharacterized protein
LIDKLFHMETKVLAGEIKHLLNTRLEGIVKDVIIFGSQIKGKAGADSDYDVLIIIKCLRSRNLQRSIHDICYEFDLKYDIFLDIQIITENELKTSIWGKHPFIEDAIREGVHA